jgi:alpha-L-fucosidase
MKMTTRRDLLQLVGKTASASVLLGHRDVPAAQSETRHTTPSRGRQLLDLLQRFVDLRFGMFLHFNMATFQDREWGDPASSPDLFNPTALDTDQWAAAARSANMTWSCLTTRHHDGFCIWPTKTAAAILSLRDDIRHFNVTPPKIQLIKDQLTELFSGYGEIDILITDGWDGPWSRITYEEVPFREIYEHIKNLQPNCLICDLNASQYPASGLYYSDVKTFEQNAGQKSRRAATCRLFLV